jgi:hypothetical protein
MNLQFNKIKTKTRYCIGAIFKNESEILEEWIKHYINEGCDYFFLIDNGSTDNYYNIILKYNSIIDLVIDDTKYAQRLLYNKYFSNKTKQYTWILICDLDEFIYSRNGFNTIKDFLKTIHIEVSQIAIPWKMYGSNGYNTLEKKEPVSAISSFYKRADYTDDDTILCKCIIRSSRIKLLWVHMHEQTIGKTILSNYTQINNYHVIPINKKVLENSNLHLNHYCIRSLEWFTRVKMTRGDACTKGNVRNIEYYNRYDKESNKIIDTELKLKKQRRQPSRTIVFRNNINLFYLK